MAQINNWNHTGRFSGFLHFYESYNVMELWKHTLFILQKINHFEHKSRILFSYEIKMSVFYLVKVYDVIFSTKCFTPLGCKSAHRAMAECLVAVFFQI